MTESCGSYAARREQEMGGDAFPPYVSEAAWRAAFAAVPAPPTEGEYFTASPEWQAAWEAVAIKGRP